LLETNPVPLAPCHCDPLCENFLDDGNKMWIVDWEYSGMNDPLWDLGDLSVEAGMDENQENDMLIAYFGKEPTAAQKGRVIIYKAMCDLLWTLWGLIQHADKNPAEDFWAYAIERFKRCKLLMQNPDFKGSPRVMEINIDHDLIKSMNKKSKDSTNLLDDLALLLFDQSIILEGKIPDSLNEFNKRMTKVMQLSI